MRHAFLIATHNNVEITKNFLSLYDDEEIDFYIHIDKKAKNFNKDLLESICKKSKVYFTDRISIYWGTFSQIEVELLLLSEAIKGNYDYYHFISGTDIPLFTKTKFKDFFYKHRGKEFVEYSPDDIAKENKVNERIRYYYFLMNSIRSKNSLIRKPQTFLRELSLKIQKIIKVKRNTQIKVSYGSNWFDITGDFAKCVLEKKGWIRKHFHHTCCADEIFLQTILKDSNFYKNNYYLIPSQERLIQWGRYVDWERGNPYTFKEKDFNEIIQIESSFFIRKFDYKQDPVIVEKLFLYLKNKEMKDDV